MKTELETSSIEKLLIFSDLEGGQTNNGVDTSYAVLKSYCDQIGVQVEMVTLSDFPNHVRFPLSKEEGIYWLPGFIRSKIKSLVAEAVESEKTAIHIATEARIGQMARNVCLSEGIPFTTAYHTEFPEYVPRRMGALLERFVFDAPLSGLKFVMKQLFRKPGEWIVKNLDKLPPILKKPRKGVESLGRGFGTLIKPLAYLFFANFHKKADAVFTRTPQMVDKIEAANFGNIELWSGAIDMERFTPESETPMDRSDFWREHDVELEPDDVVMLYVGRIAGEKNLERLLELSGTPVQTPAGVKKLKTVLVGKGPDMDWLADAYPNNTYFIGPQYGEALIDCYRQSDVFVFPSKTDTFGLVLLEALATGRPVAAFAGEPGPEAINQTLGQMDSGEPWVATHESLGAAVIQALCVDPEALAGPEREWLVENFSTQKSSANFLRKQVLAKGTNQ